MEELVYNKRILSKKIDNPKRVQGGKDSRIQVKWLIFFL